MNEEISIKQTREKFLPYINVVRLILNNYYY